MLRPFIPAKNHDQSKRFYEALGFASEYADSNIAIMSHGIDSFILQNFYVKELADNFMVQLTVDDAGAWWKEHDPVGVADKLGIQAPIPPSMQPWGLVVGFIYDPSGVLWHITQTAR